MHALSPGKALLSVQNISRSYGGQRVLDDVSLTLHEGDRVGLIGRNGSGKSTLLRIMAGFDTPDGGVVTSSRGVRVGMLAQECRLAPHTTVAMTLDEAAAGLREQLRAYRAAMERLAHLPGDCWEYREAQEECDELERVLDAARAWDLDHEVKRVSVALGLPDGVRRADTLSGGELRRLDLAVKLIGRPDVLLLDEPTNHIDTPSAEWIERFLEDYKGSCVLVTHDRYFLDRIVTRIAELEFAKLSSFPGNYERFLEYKAGVDETRARTEANRLAFIRRELDWLRRGPKARGTKQKARIGRAKDVMEQGSPQRHKDFLFEIPEPQPLGKIILEARAIEHGYGVRILFRDFSITMQKHMRVGILGPNGSGKTTLLRVLMGLEEPRRGEVVRGDATRFLYLDQVHQEVEPHETILQFVSEGAKYVEINQRRLYVPAYLERFLFDKASVDMPIGNLSGGERNRLDMVKKLLHGGNFLVLDEPTNDLDLYTLRILEETIEAFEGCALVVSHDRYFLNRICTHMLLFEEGGVLTQITGNYDDYLLYRARRKDAAEGLPRKTPRPLSHLPRRSGERRLTWREKQELETIEAAIGKAEEEVAQLEAEIQASAFYQQDHTRVQETLAAHHAAREKVARLYARWEELEAVNAGEG